MDCIISLLIWNILGWWLLDLHTFNCIKVIGDLEINGIHMSVDCSDQFPHTGDIFFISSTSMTLNGGGRVGYRICSRFLSGESLGTPIA